MKLTANLARMKKVASRIEGLSSFLAQTFHERLIDNIFTNKYGFENAQSTVNQKGGFLPLVDSGQYASSIIVDGNHVKIKSGNHSSGISFSELGTILEYGRMDKHIMPMPVWRLTLADFKKELPQLINKYFQ